MHIFLVPRRHHHKEQEADPIDHQHLDGVI